MLRIIGFPRLPGFASTFTMILSIMVPLTLCSQTFIQLDDLSGYRQNVPSSVLDSLEEYSNGIHDIVSLNSEVNDFRVYDFGFYHHTKSYEGGIPDILSLVKTEIESATGNYFLIAHEINDLGELERIWSFFQLDTDGFSCLEDSLISIDMQAYFDSQLMHYQSNISRAFDLKVSSLKNLMQALEDGYCCSEFQAIENPAARISQARSGAFECISDFSVVEYVFSELEYDTTFHSFFGHFKEIMGFLQDCQGSDLKPLASKGIVPKCFWASGADIDSVIFFTGLDLSCHCGHIDGISAELVELIEFVGDFFVFTVNYYQLIHSYLSYYAYCKFQVDLSHAERQMVLDMLIDNSSHSWSLSIFKSGMDFAADKLGPRLVRPLAYIQENLIDCHKYKKRIIRFELMVDMLLKWETWSQFFDSLMAEISEMISQSGVFTKRERYWTCYYITRIAVNVIALPKGAVKVAKLKTTLMAKNISPHQLTIRHRTNSKQVRRYIKTLERTSPDYQNLTPTERLTFNNDFHNNYVGMVTVNERGLFGAWKELFTLNAHPTLRRNSNFLEDFAKSAAGTKFQHIPTGPMVGKKIGHTFSKHGSHNTKQLTNQAVNGNVPQGQWLDDVLAEDFIARHLSQLGQGVIDIPIPNAERGLGRVFKVGTGEIVELTHIRLVPSGSGVKTAYPINQTLEPLKKIGTFVP